MKTKVNYNGSDVEITLTPSQIEALKKAAERQRDNINSFEDALKWKGETRKQFDKRTEHDTPGQKAGKAIELFAEALRNGKKLGQDDYWYYPYFDCSGSGFSYYSYDYDRTSLIVGSRLCVCTAADAVHMGKCMLETYRIYHLED